MTRSLRDLQGIVHALKDRGVALRTTEQPVDTSMAARNAVPDMMDVFAAVETNLRRERQMQAIAAAKARGVSTGRKPKIVPRETRPKESCSRSSAGTSAATVAAGCVSSLVGG